MTEHYLSPGLPRVFAHRGLAVAAPENTLLAFQHAMDAGAIYLETDVHATRDGVAVIAHDPDLARIAGREGLVQEHTLDQLQTIDLGHGQTFATLAEAFERFPSARFNIDIKSAAAVAPTVAAVLDSGARDRVLVSSFSERRRRAALDRLPGVASSASAPRFARALIAGKLGFSPGVRQALRGLAAVQVPERGLGMTITTRRMIARLHDAGVEVHVWTINDPQRMRELLELGVDGLVTDRVDLALQVVADWSGRSSTR